MYGHEDHKPNERDRTSLRPRRGLSGWWLAPLLIALLPAACFIIDPGLSEPPARSLAPDRGGSDGASDADLDLGPERACATAEDRCSDGRPQRCADDGLGWVDEPACGPETVCLAGECVEVPPGFGSYCHDDKPCPEELACQGGICLTRPPGDAGAPCLDDLECDAPAFCGGQGICTEGELGDDCLSDDDCSARAPICTGDRVCGLGAVGDACFGDASCTAGLRCGPQHRCQLGAEDEPCDELGDCHPTAPICSAEGRCQDGDDGDPCEGDDDCVQPGGGCDQGACRVDGEGGLCQGDEDCPVTAALCLLGRCQDGSAGDGCSLDRHCGEGLLCGPEGRCQNGLAGDPCATSADCGPLAPICYEDRCRTGGPGEVCETSDDCGADAPRCGPDAACQPGLEGDPCDGPLDCDPDEAPVCTAAGTCADGDDGDPCEVDGDCGPGGICLGGELCSSGAEGARCVDADDCRLPAFTCVAEHCFDGSDGDPCTQDRECAASAPECGPAGCQDGGAGDPCRFDRDCDPTLRCGPVGCQVGEEGQPCGDPGDCDPESAPICSSAGRCQDGSAGDGCGDDDDCEVAPRCGPAGCQQGLESQPCLDADDCHPELAPICSTASRCQDGSDGDACGGDTDCQGALLCGPRACQDGLEPDPCANGGDCACDHYCAPDESCRDGSADDPCSADVECAGDLLCGPTVCQLGDEGEPCTGANDCRTDSGLYCGPDAQCHDGTDNDPCELDAQCLDDLLCGPTVCQPGEELDPCGDDGDCSPQAAPFCASDGKCHDGSADDPCLDDEQCVGGLLCGPTVCQVGDEGEPCETIDDCIETLYCGPDEECHDGTLSDPCNTSEECQSTMICGPSWGLCQESDFAEVIAGTFNVGCFADDPAGCLPEDPYPTRHRVTLTRNFYVEMHEAGQDEWLDALEFNPSFHQSCFDTCPVERITWFDALAYANARSEAAGLETCYDLTDCTFDLGTGTICSSVPEVDLDCLGYRLPTEAEWEYSARAGTTTAFYSGPMTSGGGACNEDAPDHLEGIAWYCKNAGGESQGSEQLGANDLGLTDSAGNVSEWVWDRFAAYPTDPITDPVGPTGNADDDRVHRGGSFFAVPVEARHASRAQASPDTRSKEIGLRLVRTAP